MKFAHTLLLGSLVSFPAVASVSPYDLQAFLGDYQLVQAARGTCAENLTIAYTAGSDKDEDLGSLAVGDVVFSALDRGWQESGDRGGECTRSESKSDHDFLSSRPVLRNHTERYVRGGMEESKETEVRLWNDGRVEVETELHGHACGDRSSKCFYVKADAPDHGKDQGRDQGKDQGQGPGQQDQGKGQGQGQQDQGQRDQGKGQGKGQGQNGQGPYQK